MKIDFFVQVSKKHDGKLVVEPPSSKDDSTAAAEKAPFDDLLLALDAAKARLG